MFDTGAHIGAYNMAVDEESLARAQAGEQVPVLRFYTWDPAAVSIGRFQKISDAVNADACERRGIDIVRRITGGRAVLHDLDSPTVSLRALTIPSFPRMSSAPTNSSPPDFSRASGTSASPPRWSRVPNRHAALVKKNAKDPACFSSPSWYEILVHGRKIIGSAQRRLSGAFLQHGSILMDYDPALEADVIPGGGSNDVVTSITQELGRDMPREDVKHAFVKGFSEALAINFKT